MKKIILFSSIACALTACGGDGADPAPRTEPPAVSGKLTYTDESGKLVGELRGEQIAEIELIAADNQAASGLSVRSVQPNKDFADDSLLSVFLFDLVAPDRPNEYIASVLIQGVSNDLVGLNDCFNSPIMSDCDSNSRLTIEPATGMIKWEQNKAKTLKKGTGILSEKVYVSPEYFYVSGSLSSTIPPTSLIFQKNRFPVSQGIISTLKDSELGDVSFTDIDYEYTYPEISSPPVIPPPSEMHLSLYGESGSLDINLTTSTLNTYRREANSLRYKWECVENCSVQMTSIIAGQRISVQNAKLRNTAYPLQTVELNGAIDFKPHNSKISMKKHVINTGQFLVSTSVSNNTARHTASFPTPPEALTCNDGKELMIERENQTIKSVVVACDHWDRVAKKNIETVFGACGLPNTPTCTGASLSADGHTFTFVKTKLSNNEELNGTLYFAGVAAADPAITTP